VSETRRPLRADARRNRDAVLSAARDVFAELGTAASLEEIARRAGVGIGTLYRNFPGRQDLITAVYVDEVEALCATAAELADLPPWDALVGWLRRFVSYVNTKRALYELLDKESDLLPSCRASMYGAGTPLLERAQAAGVARADVAFDDVLHMVNGLAGTTFKDEAQRDRILEIALAGLRPRSGG
jgi:AcrR family transcriptional regulator